MSDYSVLVHPAASRMAERLTAITSWHGLIPIGFELVALQAPQLLVELGTHSGDSYCAFCQAVDMTGVQSQCFAVDTWVGDQHSGNYGPEILADLKSHHDPRYSRFSTLLQDTFDNAVNHFEDESIDLLHIDGLHTYDAVKHDFTTWRPKLSERAIVLFHDVAVRQNDFGVRTYWNELRSSYRAIEFNFSHGLGVLAVGKLQGPMQDLFDLSPAELSAFHDIFEALGRRIISEAAVRETSLALTATRSELQTAAAKTHLEWSQRIQAEEQHAKAVAELERVKQQYHVDLQAAMEKTHSEWTRRVLAEQALALTRSELENLRTALQAEAEKTRQESSQRVRTEEKLAKACSDLAEAQAEAGFFRSQHSQALASRSWKITAPLRAATSLLKRGSPGPVHEKPHSRETPQQAQGETDATPEGDPGSRVPDGQDEWNRFGRARLSTLFLGDRVLDFARGNPPVVSIILVLFNQAHLSLLGLESIIANADVDYELVIVDNASSDQTDELLRRVRGVQIIRNAENLGFGPACMQAVAVASAPYLCFFNNDALLEPQALSTALANFSPSGEVGVVGGKILLADGRLQEAGSIVWSDGSALGYGRLDNPALPAYQFRRPVDYCSGAFLFTPRALFSQLGGFRDLFAPAYYEDTDYCMRVWQQGLQVVYEPGAVIRHFESASSGGNEKAQFQMAAHQLKFVQEWGAVLARHLPPAMSNVPRARIATAVAGLRILYLDDCIPHRELGSGFPRSNNIVRELVSLGHHVACVAVSFPLGAPSDEYRDIPHEVELIDGCGDCASVLSDYLPASDLVWVSRPHNMERFLLAVAHLAKPCETPIIYDAEAIFSDRDRLKAQITGRQISPQLLAARSAIEAARARAANVTLAVSERDATALKSLGVQAVHVVGHCLEAVPTDQPHAGRSIFLFVGAIHDDDNPNLDSLRFFCREVWPTVGKSTGAELVIAGFGTEKFAVEFRSPGIRIVGAQEDLRALYQSARVFVVPTRYCAGVPYKAHEAAAHGVPMVVTPIILDQLGWTDGKQCLVGSDAGQFAEKCIQLFQNEALWNTIRDNALQNVRSELSASAFHARVAEVLDSLSGKSASPASTGSVQSATLRQARDLTGLETVSTGALVIEKQTNDF